MHHRRINRYHMRHPYPEIPVTYHEHHDFLHSPPDWVHSHPEFHPRPAMSLVVHQVTKVTAPITTTPAPETTTLLPPYSPIAQVYRLQVNPDGSMQQVPQQNFGPGGGGRPGGGKGRRKKKRQRQQQQLKQQPQSPDYSQMLSGNPGLIQSLDYETTVSPQSASGPLQQLQVMSQQGIQLIDPSSSSGMSFWRKKKKKRK